MVLLAVIGTQLVQGVDFLFLNLRNKGVFYINIIYDGFFSTSLERKKCRSHVTV